MSPKHLLIAIAILAFAGLAAVVILKPSGSSPLSLLSAKGTVQLASEPGDAEIWIDGVRKGNTPADKGMTFAINLPEGSHKLEMRLAKEPVRLLGSKDLVVAADTVQSVTLTLAEDEEARKAWDAAREAARFENRGDGTVWDSKTKLYWLKDANAFGKKTWEDANAVCASLASGQAGLSDGSKVGQWRLPTKDEVEAFVNPKFTNPCLPPVHPFSSLQTSRGYWSGTSANGYSYSSDYAWFMDLYGGMVGTQEKTRTFCVWPVRGGP